LLGVGRFVVRAWIAVVLIGYALLFVGADASGSPWRARATRRASAAAASASRLGTCSSGSIAEALFWTFHPFSPVSVGYYEERRPDRASPPCAKKKGDERALLREGQPLLLRPDRSRPVDPRAMERTILAEIRAQKGRIGLADVMRVTGLPRDEADPLMSRLMLDYEGSVEVSEEGGIVYRFEAMRKYGRGRRPSPRSRARGRSGRVMKAMSPLTGNGAGSNFLIVAAERLQPADELRRAEQRADHREDPACC
jgi:hypothetical protein